MGPVVSHPYQAGFYRKYNLLTYQKPCRNPQIGGIGGRNYYIMANNNIKIISLIALLLVCSHSTAWAKDKHKATQMTTQTSASEQAQAERMTQELQQILQQVHALEEENNQLRQKIETATAQNQQLSENIDHMRPAAVAPSTLAINQATINQ